MTGLTFTYSSQFPGPADQGILIKNRGNNAKLSSRMAMPQKFYPSSNDGMFAAARKTYIADGGGGTILSGNNDASQLTQLKRINAVGKSSTHTQNLDRNPEISFRSQARTERNSAVRRCRAGGCTAPKKKGALNNPYKSGGRSALTGTGNRQIFAPK
jgi:hypothetical protein